MNKTDDFWADLFKQSKGKPFDPEVQLLKDLEDRNGGSEEMEKLFKNLSENHPKIFAAFYKYLMASFLVVKYNPQHKEVILESILSTIKSCLTGDGLLILSRELDVVPEDLSPEARKVHEDRLMALVDQLNPMKSTDLDVVLPEDVARMIHPRKLQRLSPKPPAYTSFSAPVFAEKKEILH